MQNIQGFGCACRLKIPFNQKVEWTGWVLPQLSVSTALILSTDRNERKKEKKKNKIYLECESNQDVVFFWDVVHVGKSECNSVTLARDFHRACWVNIESYVVGRGADPHPL